MPKSQSTRAAEGGKTISLGLVRLRCRTAANEINSVSKLLSIAAAAADAESDERVELPDGALVETLEAAIKRLDAVSSALDEVEFTRQPTEEEQRKVNEQDEQIARYVEEMKARRLS